MVRLLSLLILLLVPNPFASQDSMRAEPKGQTPSAAVRPVRPGAVPATPAHSRVEPQAGRPDAILGEPVPALPDSAPGIVDPQEHSTL